MDASQVVGYLAGALTTLCVLPQIIRAIRTGSTRDLSYVFIFTLISGMALWLTYGIMIKQVPVVIPNAVSFCLNTILLIVKLVQDNKPQRIPAPVPLPPVPLISNSNNDAV